MGDWAAGPALDAEIARRVMGWFQYPQPGERILLKRGTRIPVPPRYSTDIAAAWQVVEHMQGARFGCEIWCPNSGGMMPRVKFYPDAVVEHEVAAETVPLAICLAALAACRVEA